MEQVILETPRLTLRAPCADDVDAIVRAGQDPELPRWTTVPSPYSRADTEDFVALTAERWTEGSHATWAMLCDGELVGTIGLHHIDPHPAGGQAELGYWTAAPFRGRGLLTEAAEAVIDWGFGTQGLARIRWQAAVGNIPSARSARRLGFRYEGMLRQALASSRGRDDGWIAGLLRTDDRAPVPWPLSLDD